MNRKIKFEKLGDNFLRWRRNCSRPNQFFIRYWHTIKRRKFFRSEQKVENSGDNVKKVRKRIVTLSLNYLKTY